MQQRGMPRKVAAMLVVSGATACNAFTGVDHLRFGAELGASSSAASPGTGGGAAGRRPSKRRGRRWWQRHGAPACATDVHGLAVRHPAPRLVPRSSRVFTREQPGARVAKGAPMSLRYPSAEPRLLAALVTTCALSVNACAPAEDSYEGETVDADELGVSVSSASLGGHPAWAHFTNPPAFGGGNDPTTSPRTMRLIDETLRGSAYHSARRFTA